MRFTPDNFFALLKQVVTGGGKLSVTPFGTNTPQASALAAADGGINEDITVSLGDAALGAGTTLTTDSQGLRALSNAATNTVIGTFGFVVPRDYDQATDKLRIRVQAAMNGGTDTPTISLACSTLLPAGTFQADGKTLNLTTTLVNQGTFSGSTVTALNPMTISSTLSSTQAIYEFDLSGLGLTRDQVLSLKLSVGAHTTNAAVVYGFNLVYAWTIVAFTEDTLGNDPTDLGGNDVFNNPLR